MIVFLLACDVATEPEPAAASVIVPLSDARLARRISIDLRGKLPSAEEIATAEGESGVEALTDTWLESAEFEDHLAEAVAEDWLLELDILEIDPEEFGWDPTADYALSRMASGEVSHLFAHIVATDRPFTEIVTADWTMANEALGSLLPLTWIDTDASKEWREAQYTDGRPAGGILMTSGLWLRFSTTIFNYNRGRAAALTRMLLCYEYLTRPVAFSNLDDNSTDGLLLAVQSDSNCLACHASLDPLASSLFGFWPYEDKDGSELINYHPEREQYGESLMGAKPAYFGTPLDGPAQLGPLVAGDPRFSMCAATRAAERLWARPTTPDDMPAVAGFRDELTAGDYQYKAMLKAVLAGEEYRAGDLTDSASDADRDRVKTLRPMTPLTLASVVEDLTGFRWEFRGWDQLSSDAMGYRLLLGGADGDMVNVTALEPGLSRSLVIRRMAQAAASAVVIADLAATPDQRRLLGAAGGDIPSETGEAFETELNALHLRIFSVPPDSTQIEEESKLFEDVLALGTPSEAWSSLVSVLLRDPDFWSY